MDETSSDSPVRQGLEVINCSTLPSDIIPEILVRLPVKSLLKFQCVSKSWLSLISSPKFRKTHLKNSTNNPNLTVHRIMFTLPRRIDLKHFSVRSLLDKPTTDAVEISCPRKIRSKYVSLIGSCNGLICIATDIKDFYLWNPSLRKSKKLPYGNVPLAGGYVTCGFGFDETNEDYKVVVIYNLPLNAGGYATTVRIYSLKTNSWRRIEEEFKGGVPLYDRCGFAQGKLHWQSTSNEGSSSAWDIVALDLDKETYGMVEQPKYGEGDFDSMLGVVGGCIAVLCSFPKTCADVWVLKDYLVKESWTKVVSIPYDDGVGKSINSMPLLILPDGEVLCVLESSLIVYNPKDNSFRYPQINNLNDFLGVSTYVESLVSPNADGE